MLPQHLDHWLAPFPAKVTAVTNSSGTYLYEWTEQITDGSGGYTNAVPARSGNNTVDPALELNNRNLTPSNTVVWMRFRGMSGANTVYEFDGSGMASASGASLVVQEDDGSPSYTGINTINVVTGVNTGLNISNPAAGIAGLTIDPASLTTAGVINTSNQSFDGTKTFQDSIVVGDVGITNQIKVTFLNKSSLGSEQSESYISDFGGSIEFLAGAAVTPPTSPDYAVWRLRSQSSNTLGTFCIFSWDVSDGAYIDARYSVIDSGNVERVGKYGTLPDGSTVSGGLITSISNTSAAEAAQDAVGTILTNTDTVSFVYTDATPTINASVITQMSITSDASGIKLDGDNGSPGNSKYYGTNTSGTKGFYDLMITSLPLSTADGGTGADLSASNEGVVILAVTSNPLSTYQGSTVADVSGSAGGTYSATEQQLINDLATAVNDILARLRSSKLIAT